MLDGGIRCHYDHDGAMGGLAAVFAATARLHIFFQVIVAQFAANRSAIDGENSPKIGLHQNTHGVTATRCRQPPRRRANSALESECNRSSACAHATLFYRAFFGIGYGSKYILLGERTRA